MATQAQTRESVSQATSPQPSMVEELAQLRIDRAIRLLQDHYSAEAEISEHYGLIRRVGRNTGYYRVRSCDDPETWYLTTAVSCNCTDATSGLAYRLLGGWCKHRIAIWWLRNGQPIPGVSFARRRGELIAVIDPAARR